MLSGMGRPTICRHSLINMSAIVVVSQPQSYRCFSQSVSWIKECCLRNILLNQSVLCSSFGGISTGYCHWPTIPPTTPTSRRLSLTHTMHWCANSNRCAINLIAQTYSLLLAKQTFKVFVRRNYWAKVCLSDQALLLHFGTSAIPVGAVDQQSAGTLLLQSAINDNLCYDFHSTCHVVKLRVIGEMDEKMKSRDLLGCSWGSTGVK